MRVLITGSRDWSDTAALRAVLDELLAEHHGLVLVHGGCPRGADALADRWARDHPREVLVDRYPANWGRYGRAAGLRRNGDMVRAGADLCVAFFVPGAGNRGTAHCAKLARRAGITVRRVEEPARLSCGHTPDVHDEAKRRLAESMRRGGDL